MSYKVQIIRGSSDLRFGRHYTKDLGDDLHEAVKCAKEIKNKLDSCSYHYKYLCVVDETGKQHWAGKSLS